MRVTSPKYMSALTCAVVLFTWASVAVAQDSESTSSLDGKLVAQNKGKDAKKKSGDESGEDGEDGEDGGEEGEEGEAQAAQPSTQLQRGNRMEFDGRLIKGESAGSGAVFLFQRVPRPLPSMVDRRTSYLRQTVEETLGDKSAKKFEKSKEKTLEEQKKADSNKNK